MEHEAKSPARHEAQKRSNGLILSYQALQQFLGWLGLALPLSLAGYSILSGHPLRPSISDYYYSAMGDVFVGILCAIGVFLLFYRGYDPLPDEWISDRQVSFVAGLAALGVAGFPANRLGLPACYPTPDDCLTFGITAHPNWLHDTCAGVFFVCLALFCLVLFTRGDRTADHRMIWTRRNCIFVTCGSVILLSLLALLPTMLSPGLRQSLAPVHYVFWCETIGILAFAFSWLTKGKADETIASLVERAM
jgi:hypothetical protein